MSTQLRDQVRRKPRLSEQVAQTLRDQLQAGSFPVGGKLPPETALTARFGVSRAVVREAISALAADGLVEPRQGAGVFVLEPAPHPGWTIGGDTSKLSTALYVLEVRLAIEVESAALAAIRRSSAQEAQIQEAFFEFDRLLGLGEPTGGADFAFHRAIAGATNNPFYVEVLDGLGSRTIPCDVTSPWATERELAFDYQAGLQREHARILSAISAQDEQGARDAMRRHLSASQERYGGRLAERTQRFSGSNPQLHP
ncbi:FadR family transcriptional regulator [Arsenicitalea aurantiaca]|uniref:FadR family transcriptional regulator n=1 Tax=Arsenicitalea aurantiaca TaxID=1783274 RepID=A0A433X7N0_9HYPH|nr:FadR/GntR family transcriptional regulator [Arsenicitalea aurantiaca]RUT30062.1 FadR family transcriptional regulator [Arsenicitalea aurantiaca]